MGSEAILEEYYKAAMSADWKSMIDYFQAHSENMYSPVTSSLDTVLHLAVHSYEVQPLKDLLEIVKESEVPLTEKDFLKKTNEFGNTALHEATIYGNYEAVKLLVELCPELLSVPNAFGETPLFTAAGFAETEIVEFLIRSKPEQCVDDNGHLLSIHSKRSEDDLSILSAAIIGQNFGNNSSLY
jgi:ankyrin repeat protein